MGKLFLSLLITFLSVNSYANKPLVFGVFEYQPKTTVSERFTPLADYLSSQLPEHTVELRVLDSLELMNAVRDHQVDILLTNPYHYELMRNSVSIDGIAATLQKLHDGKTIDSLGGVIFTLANENAIRDLADLQKASIATPSKKNTGAYLIPLYEAYKAKVKLQPEQFIETGNNDTVIEAVLAGRAQVGFLRTGVLENWFDKGKLKPKDLKIINRKHADSYPLVVSTDLYPNWPFIFMPGLDNDLQREITVALFSLRKEHPAAISAGIGGFVSPSNYQSYEKILRALKQKPYNIPEELNIAQFWNLYKWPVVSFTLLLLTIIGLLVFSEIMRNRIQERDKKLIKQSELDRTLLKLPKYAEDHNEAELMQFATEQVERLTDSKIAFMHLYNHFEQTIELVSWSENTLKSYCHVENYERHYDLNEAGLWADSVRKKQAVVVNDYASHPYKNGMPEGHAHLQRMISLPVLDGDRVVMIAGIGNKANEYTQADVDLCQLVCNEVWHLIKEERTQKEMEQQKNKYEDLLNDIGSQYIVFSYDPFKKQVLYLSAGFEQIFDKPRFALFHKDWMEEIDWTPESVKDFAAAIEEIQVKQFAETSLRMTFLNEIGEKRVVKFQLHGNYEYAELVSIDGLIKDITEEIESENKLKQAAQVFDYANEGILITNNQNIIIRANRRLENITGYKESELIGKNPRVFSSGEQNSIFYEGMWNSLQLLGYWEGDLFNRKKNGDVYPCRVKISSVFDDENKPQYYIALFSDITAEREQQKQLEHMAHYDALTSLPNRLLLTDRIHQAITALERSDDVLAILFVDLDGFKEINDTHGHAYGDALLKIISSRLKDVIRKHDTVARLGGDEFVLLLSGNSEKNLYEVEQRILAEINETVVFKGTVLQVSGSIGVVYYHAEMDENLDPDQLIRLADQTMYKAKTKGKNRIEHYQWEDNQDNQEILAAFDNREFKLFYQPKVDFKMGLVTSLEALIRWQHPSKGIIAPFFFLDKIKQLDLTSKLSILVVKEAGRFLTEMKKTGIDINVSINIWW